jgi:hypothetical protein
MPNKIIRTRGPVGSERSSASEGRSKPSYKVVNAITGRVHAFGTTKANAEKQVRLLNAIEHGMIPRRKK